MSGVSSIDRMPPEIRKLISDCFELGWTVTEVAEHLRELGADVSRSAVGRKRKEWGEIVAKVAESRACAEVLVRSFKDAPASEVAQANVEMLQSLLLRYLRGQMEEEAVKLTPSEFMMLGKASSSLGGARRAEVDTTVAAMKAATAMEAENGQGEGGKDTVQIEFVDPPEYDPVTKMFLKKPENEEIAEIAPTDAKSSSEAS